MNSRRLRQQEAESPQAVSHKDEGLQDLEDRTRAVIRELESVTEQLIEALRGRERK